MKIIEYGNKKGKAVLCIPGVFMAAECFRRLAEELADYRMVCVTLDGFHPDSDEFESLEQQTDKLVRMLQEAGCIPLRSRLHILRQAKDRHSG